MKILLKQEVYKLIKRNATVFSAAGLIFYIFLMVGAAKIYPEIFDAKVLTTKSYNAYAWIIFIMIISASSTVSSEFQYGTIKNLLYRKYSRRQILISKWGALFLQSLSLYIITIIISVFASHFFLSLYSRDGSLTMISQILTNGIGNFINLWLVISCVLLLACIFNNIGISVLAGLLFYFMASSISSLMLPVIEKYRWLKWNPVNMLNLSNQTNTEALLSPVTQLSNLQLVLGNIIYIIIFFYLGYISFQSKNI